MSVDYQQQKSGAAKPAVKITEAPPQVVVDETPYLLGSVDPDIKTPSPVFLAIISGLTAKHGVAHWTGSGSTQEARVKEARRAEQNILEQLLKEN